MKRKSVVAASVGAAMLAGAAPAAKDPPPVATYWMDVATTSGFGAGMAAGGRPNMSQIMNMMSGQSSAAHTLELRLASRDKAPQPAADHLIPPGLQMGLSLPLLAPEAVKPTKDGVPGMPANFERPKGRMLIYWGCGEHAGAGQPTVIDFSKLAAGQVPPEMKAFASAAAKAAVRPGAGSAPGYGEWPNRKDSRAVPAAGSLVGAHKVQANYAPPIAFSLAPGQDFMTSLDLAEAGVLPSGAARLAWRPAANATGYALAMFGASGNGDVIMWTSAKSAAAFPHLDYLPPSEVTRLIGAGAVLPPSTSQCLLPTEVAKAAPAGMVTMIGYGPEAHFAEKPKAPKWTTMVRFKTTASLIRGMGGTMGAAGPAPGQQATPQQAPQPQPRKKRRSLLGDIIKDATGIPVPR